MGSGLNFLGNAIDKTPSAGSWQDVDCSTNVPAGATGVILEVQNTGAAAYNAAFRKNGSSEDRTQNTLASQQQAVYVGLDSNRIFEAYIGDATVKLWLIGYTDDTCTFFDNAIDKTPSTGSWLDVDCSANIPSGAKGVFIVIVNGTTANRNGGARNNGSTDTYPYQIFYYPSRFAYQVRGVDANRIFEARIDNAEVKVWLLGYVGSAAPVTFKVNGVDKSLTTTGAWTDVDVTSDTDAAADGALIDLKMTQWTNYNGNIRKNGSTDNRTTAEQLRSSGTEGQCVTRGIGMDASQIFEGWIENANLDFYLIGYAKPAGGVLKEVPDSIGLSDSILRHKSLLPISDSVGTADVARTDKSPLIMADALSLVDAILRNKQFALADTIALAEFVDVIKGLILKTVTDSIGLSDAVRREKLLAILDTLALVDAANTPFRVLQALDVLGVEDSASINKVLKVAESISLAEVVEVGVGGVKKTRLFLVLGDLAVQIAGD
jgi:hypothetical protein